MRPEEQEEYLRRMALSLLGATVGEWRELNFYYRGIVDISTARFEVVRKDGSRERISPPEEACEVMDDLRVNMLIPGKGTWYSSSFVLEYPNYYHISYDYDNEPEFAFSPSSASYALDLQYFPRDEEHIPDWLRQKLREAESGQG